MKTIACIASNLQIYLLRCWAAKQNLCILNKTCYGRKKAKLNFGPQLQKKGLMQKQHPPKKHRLNSKTWCW